MALRSAMEEEEARLSAAADLPLYEFLGLRFDRIEADLIVARMQVTERSTQLYGALHGGISAVLVEGIASSGAIMATSKPAVGLDITCSHFQGAPLGTNLIVTGKPIHTGKTLQVWEVRIEVDPLGSTTGSTVRPKSRSNLLAVGRMTAFILDKPQQGSRKEAKEIAREGKSPPVIRPNPSLGMRRPIIEDFIGLQPILVRRDLVLGRLLVTEQSMQPFRALHGGVSALVVEALAGIGAELAAGGAQVVGADVACRHLRGAPIGTAVIAMAVPLRIGGKVQVWDVKMFEDLHPEDVFSVSHIGTQMTGPFSVKDVVGSREGPLIAAGSCTCFVLGKAGQRSDTEQGPNDHNGHSKL